MKRLVTILLFSCSTILIAQPCLPEGIIFTTQTQIDSFQINYPGCTEIEGSVKIGLPTSNSNITNLEGLNEITRINGGLHIINNELLSDFSGLNSLKYCFDLQMHGNNSIVNLQGFNSLDSIPIYLIINEFDSLETISGFNNLVHIGDNTFINYNPNLESIVGFNSLFSAGPIYLNHNNSLTDLSGFSSLTSILGLYVSNNNSLTNLHGFDQLDTIHYDLSIFQCNDIIGLSSLQNLSYIGGHVNISGNPQLVSLADLESVDLTSMWGLTIMNNSSLSECAINSICSLLDSSNISIIIENNAPGCNSQQEVETACDTVGISNFKIDEGISIFPNPASETISIKILSNRLEKNNHTIEIMKLTGETIISHVFDGRTSTISLKGLSSGIYIYTLKTNTEILKRGKLLIQ